MLIGADFTENDLALFNKSVTGQEPAVRLNLFRKLHTFRTNLSMKAAATANLSLCQLGLRIVAYDLNASPPGKIVS